MKPGVQALVILLAVLFVYSAHLLVAVHREEKSPWRSIFKGDWKTAPLAIICVEMGFLLTLVGCSMDREMALWAIAPTAILLAFASVLLRSRLIQIQRHALYNKRQFEQNKHLLTEQDRAELGMKKGKKR